MKNLHSITEKSILNCIFQLTSSLGPLLQSPCILLLPSFFPDIYLSEPLLIDTYIGTWVADLLVLSQHAVQESELILGPWRSITVKWNRSIHGKFCLFENSLQSFEKG